MKVEVTYITSVDSPKDAKIKVFEGFTTKQVDAQIREFKKKNKIVILQRRYH